MLYVKGLHDIKIFSQAADTKEQGTCCSLTIVVRWFLDISLKDLWMD